MAESPSELQAEIDKLERKHAENPEGRYFVPLANDYRKRGELDRAESLLREGLRNHPDYLSAHIVLGRCLADRGAVSEAVQEFRYVLSLDSQNLIALRTLGELALAAGDPGEAAHWYRELLGVDPMNEEARSALESLGPAPAPDVRIEPEATDDWLQPTGEPRQEIETDLPGLDTGADWASPGVGSFETGSQDGSDFRPDLMSGGDYIDLDEGGPGPADQSDPGDEVEPVEVVTETIAELYTRQGLHSRAAEVYRELIRRRGGDPALEARLAEVERLARGETPSTTAPAEAAADEPADALDFRPVPEIDLDVEIGSADAPPSDDSWLAQLDSDLEPRPGSEPEPEVGSPPELEWSPEPTPGGLPEPEAEPVADRIPEAAEESEPEPEPLPTIGAPPEQDAFASSVAAGFSAPEGEDADADVQGAPALPEMEWEAPARASAAPERTIAEVLGELASWRPGAASETEAAPPLAAPEPESRPTPAEAWAETPAADPWAAVPERPERPERASTDTAGNEAGADEPFPWEVGGGEFEVEEPGTGSEGEPAVGEPTQDEPTVDLDDYFESPPSGGEPTASESEPAPEQRRTTSEGDDEDLESFQAWLRSLKR